MSTELLTVTELADRLKVKPETIRGWATARLIPVIRVNPKVLRFDYEDVMAALRRRADHG